MTARTRKVNLSSVSRRSIGIKQARPILGDLVTAVQQGAEVVLTRNGRPAARLIRFEEETPVEKDQTTTPAERREREAREAEERFHATAQANAIGGYIGCEGPQCWALIQSISQDNLGHRIQGAR